MRKKILLHAPHLSTPGGKQTLYAALKDHFKNDVRFFIYGAQGKKESKLIFIKRMFSDYLKFYRQLRREKFDIVLLNPSLNRNSFFRDAIFAFLCRLSGTRMSVFWHGWNWGFEEKTVRKMVPLFKRTFGKAESMIVLAQEFKDCLLKYDYKGKVFLGSTTIDDQILNYEPEESKESEVDKEEQIALLFLARVERNKGVYEAIESFHRLQTRHNNLVLNIAGVGGELENAKSFVSEKGISNVNFTGWISGETKSDLLYQSDIYLLPTYHGEGMPNSILEAMACGLTVLTTDVGGIKDFFDPDHMGRIIKPKSPDDLVEKLEEIIESPELMTEISNYNSQYAREHYAPVRVANKLEDFLMTSDIYN